MFPISIISFSWKFVSKIIIDNHRLYITKFLCKQMEQLTEFVSKSFNPDRPMPASVATFPPLIRPRSLHSVVDRLSGPHPLFPGLTLGTMGPLLLPSRPASGGTSSPSSIATDKEDRGREDNDSNDRHGKFSLTHLGFFEF